ncbi:hypothetical protein D8S78_19205 [Natrialba swarupiae]|nr:hypothetical protein [Natrialba swarupiae]
MIAYIAYRGYRRNESRPMLYLSTGFVLVLGVPFVFFVVAISLVGAIGPVAVQSRSRRRRRTQPGDRSARYRLRTSNVTRLARFSSILLRTRSRS